MAGSGAGKTGIVVRKGGKDLFRADVASSFLSKFLGIMFRGTPLREPFRRPLLFVFSGDDRLSNSIHSLFCFCRFDAVFLDSGKAVVQVIPKIAAWNPMIVPASDCRYLIELPSGQAARYGLKAGVKLGF